MDVDRRREKNARALGTRLARKRRSDFADEIDVPRRGQSDPDTGNAAAEIPPTTAPPPLAPLGPSLTLIEGMLSRSIGTVVQKSLPASETCSSTVIASTRASIFELGTAFFAPGNEISFAGLQMPRIAGHDGHIRSIGHLFFG